MGIRSEAELSLINTERDAVSLGATHVLGRMTAEDLDLWTNPLNVSYLNVGFCRPKDSIPGVVNLVLKQTQA
jgi:hypothetical protein